MADATERHPAYLNWDDPKVPPRLRRGELPVGEPVVILDEIHKYARWRNLVKVCMTRKRAHAAFSSPALLAWITIGKAEIPSPGVTATSVCIRSLCEDLKLP